MICADNQVVSHIATHLFLLILIAKPLQKRQGSIILNHITMKFGRIVL